MIRRAMRPRIARSALDRHPALIVLTYHSIDPDPPTHHTAMGVTTHPEAFEEHMQWAKTRFEMISLSEGVRRLRNGRLTRTCLAVTFDDGFQSTHDHGLKILLDGRIPSTFFLNASFLQGESCWIFDVAKLESDGRTDELREIFGPCRGPSYVQYLRSSASPDIVARRGRLKQLALPSRRERQELFDETCLTTMLQNPLIEIGNHSLDHPRFCTLDLEAQRRQITDNEAYLSRFARYRRFVAVPFGKPDDWNLDTTVAIAGSGHEFVGSCGGINFAGSTGADIRRIPCDALGPGQLEERIISLGLGI